MNGYAASKWTQSHEEKLLLIEERSMSDVESESGRMELDQRFPAQQWLSRAKSYGKAFRISALSSVVIRSAIFLLPSFLHPSRNSRERLRGGDKLGPTAYLDGMRGLAALFVFFCHYFYTSFVIAEGWGHNDANYHFWKLPFVRLLFSGPSMVCIFFIISGYALSLKPLKQIRGRSFEGLLNTMTSFIFRRGFRLFLPTAASTFMVVCLLQLGAYEGTREFAYDPNYVRNVAEHHPLLEDTFSEQFLHWAGEMFNFLHFWSWEKFGGSTGYDVHLWTIPVEYRCSMVLFLSLIGLARMRTGVRLTCLAILMWFMLHNDRWEPLLFLVGTALAELDIIRGAHNSAGSASPSANSAPASLLPFEEKGSPSSPRPCKCRKVKGLAYVLLSVPALYLMSEPDAGPDGVPGWETLGALIPEYFSDRYRFWQMVGGALFVFCVARSPLWQRVFTTGPVQYLGRLSFAIYLMHGPVTHTLGYRVQRWAWTSVTGIETEAAFRSGAILAAAINIPVVLWAADIFARAVDAPIVRFTRWLETRVSITAEQR
ncbi:acyltransferase family-domain-containing protein [Apiospora rasikravindrae]|uniref:Acyltransferase family-domain-containing protein n=1 Tax=Apiospora rasikravindrae TaxID=990691 RepID=A0ABR1T8Z6_9PEZI